MLNLELGLRICDDNTPRWFETRDKFLVMAIKRNRGSDNAVKSVFQIDVVII
jgi:hypothetical protein